MVTVQAFAPTHAENPVIVACADVAITEAIKRPAKTEKFLIYPPLNM